MIDVEKLICFRFYNDDKSKMDIINHDVNKLRNAGYPDDVIYQFYEDAPYPFINGGDYD